MAAVKVDVLAHDPEPRGHASVDEALDVFDLARAIRSVKGELIFVDWVLLGLVLLHEDVADSLITSEHGLHLEGLLP